MEIDITAVKKTIEILKPNNQLYEIRIINKSGHKRISGYFRGTENLEKAFKTVDLRGANVFITLNVINDACYSRVQHECFRQVDVTTGDKEILAYDWFLIDVDPKRPSEISSTKEEFENAKVKAGSVYRYLKRREFPEPIIALSGNGVHLLYSLALKNTDENKSLIEKCLKALDFMFSDEHTEIDTSVFNPSRISKLYGTLAQKGSSTDERPHRMSKIIRLPENIYHVPKEKLELLAAEYPTEADKPVQRTNYTTQDFDIEQWLSDHGIRVNAIQPWGSGATKYILDECPFDSSHKAPDSMVVKMASGAVAFKCMHNSCAGRKWQDLRLKFEPNAYDEKENESDRRIELGWREHLAYNRNRPEIRQKMEETPDNPKWETLTQIIERPKEKRVTIKTGITELDRSIGGGLAKGEISVMSGLRASAKSTLLSQWCLNAIDLEYNVLCYSGELKDYRFAEWMLTQAAGKKYIELSQEYDNIAWVKDEEVKKRIARWTEKHFLLYNNRFGNKFADIKEDIENKILESSADLIVLDNLAILDLEKYSKTSWGDNQFVAQTEFIKDLKDMAIRCNCHICFVAHPRKSERFLRLETIAGTGNIPNLVDTAFIVHRNNQFFRTSYAEYYGKEADANMLMATNFVEIAKDRECGTQDKFVRLFFEQGTRRLLNSQDENFSYGWESGGL